MATQLDLFEQSESHCGEMRRGRGRVNYHAGVTAEDSAARACVGRGHKVLKRRWRGRGGEIDLITQSNGEVVFVEVKRSKTHDSAAFRLGTKQQRRLMASAEDYIGRQPEGLLTPMRIDVALVDQFGEVSFIENAVGAF